MVKTLPGRIILDRGLQRIARYMLKYPSSDRASLGICGCYLLLGFGTGTSASVDPACVTGEFVRIEFQYGEILDAF